MGDLTRLFTAYAEGSSLESAALTAAFLLLMLVLQKPHACLKNIQSIFNVECLYGLMDPSLLSWRSQEK